MRRVNEVPTTTLVRAIVMAIDSLSSRVTRPERRTRGVQIRLERRKSRNNFDEAGGCVSFEVTRTAARTLLSSPSPPPSFSLSLSRERYSRSTAATANALANRSDRLAAHPPPSYCRAAGSSDSCGRTEISIPSREPSLNH